MTREYKMSVLNMALKESKNGEITVVLLDGDSAMIVHGEEKAASLAKIFGYTVYAKCKNGGLFL